MRKKKDEPRDIVIEAINDEPVEELEDEDSDTKDPDASVAEPVQELKRAAAASAAVPGPAGGAADQDPPGNNTAAQTPAGEGELSGLRRQIEALVNEKGSLYDQLLRRQAEFENFRRRSEREKSEVFYRSRAEMILELLPVIDNFERALMSLENESAESSALRQGVELIHRQLRDVLGRLGLEAIESIGQPFDPHVHEAVTTEPTNDAPENTVIEEFQRGYKFGDRLLRPAKVKVASSP